MKVKETKVKKEVEEDPPNVDIEIDDDIEDFINQARAKWSKS